MCKDNFAQKSAKTHGQGASKSQQLPIKLQWVGWLNMHKPTHSYTSVCTYVHTYVYTFECIYLVQLAIQVLAIIAESMQSRQGKQAGQQSLVVSEVHRFSEISPELELQQPCRGTLMLVIKDFWNAFFEAVRQTGRNVGRFMSRDIQTLPNRRLQFFRKCSCSKNSGINWMSFGF